MAKDRLQDKKLRAEVLKRDGHRCQMCQKKKGARYLEIHHIIKWARAIFLRYDPLNCITLCKGCHYSIRNKESHYITFFQGIINGKS